MSAAHDTPIESGVFAFAVRQQGLLEALRTCLTELESLNKGIGWRDGEWHCLRVAKAAIAAHEAIPTNSELNRHRAFAMFRQRTDENRGKEFFYTAMWHGDTRPDEGERMVPGWFLPDAAMAEFFGDVKPVGYFQDVGAGRIERVGDEFQNDADVFALYRRPPADDSARTKLEAARDADLAKYGDTPTAFAMRAIAEDAWNKAIAALGEAAATGA
jgi:hypothetical protein